MWKCDICGNENEETTKSCEFCGLEREAERANSNKKRNLIIGIVLAAILVAGIIWLIFGFIINPGGADGLSNAQSYAEIMDAADNMNEDGIAFEANGIKISEDDWNHYFMTMAKNYANSQDGKYLDEINWDEKDENGQTLLEKIKYETLDEVIRMAAMESKAKEWGISLTESDLSMVDINWDYWVQVYGDDIYKELDIKDKEEFREIEERRLLSNKIWDTVNADIEKYAGDMEKLGDYTNDSSATIQIIEIAKAETGTDAKAEIEEVKKRLDGGESFSDVWVEVMGEQYLMMTGVEKTKPDSVSISKGSVVEAYKDIETTALSLGIGEMSGIIETDYSYAIIYRVAGYTELVNKIVAEGEIGINKEVIEASKIK